MRLRCDRFTIFLSRFTLCCFYFFFVADLESSFVFSILLWILAAVHRSIYLLGQTMAALSHCIHERQRLEILLSITCIHLGLATIVEPKHEQQWQQQQQQPTKQSQDTEEKKLHWPLPSKLLEAHENEWKKNWTKFSMQIFCWACDFLSTLRQRIA